MTTDENVLVHHKFSSSGGWFFTGPWFSLKNLDVIPKSDGADEDAKVLKGPIVAGMTITTKSGRTYPVWLNVVAWCVLPLVPVGLVLLVMDINVIGLAFMGAGFSGIWVFGDLAARRGRNIERVEYIGRGRRST